MSYLGLFLVVFGCLASASAAMFALWWVADWAGNRFNPWAELLVMLIGASALISALAALAALSEAA